MNDLLTRSAAQFSLLLLFYALPLALGAQSGINGYIRDEAGKPLEFATIFVKETGDGAVANVEGYYELRLPPGTYNLIFQHLGYETYTERTGASEGFNTLNVRLRVQPLDLKEVEIYEGREDPAYTVMRRAIAKADYHRQQLDYYQARVYIKGSGRLIKAPFFLRKELKKEGIDSTVAFTSESVSIVEYERPNTFRERVISVYTQGEEQGGGPMSFINGSFYQPEIAEAISPLSPRAFGHYKFELAGFFNDRGYGVNKIKVIPRNRGDNVFEGYIYIVDDLWSIHSLDLRTYKLGIGFDVRQLYNPIQEQVWLPMTQQIDVSGKILGFSFEYRYLASLSDYNIRLNPDLDVDFNVIDEKIQKELAADLARQQREQPASAGAHEKLAAGEELTRKDLRKLMKEYEKEERQEQEVPTVVENHSYTVDSLAYKRDSTYWTTIRPIPLTDYELRGYIREDSLAKVEKARAAADTLAGPNRRRRNGKSSAFQPFDLVTGYSFKLADKRYLQYSGLTSAGFNPVEGYWLASKLTYRQRGDHPYSISLIPRYGFAWQRLTWQVGAAFRFDTLHSAQTLSVRGGRYLAQYNEPYAVNELINTAYALFFERNYLSLYEREFVLAKYTKKWRSLANLELGVEWADRRHPSNATSQTWFNRDDRQYAGNTPEAFELTEPLAERERAFLVDAAFEIRPWQRYRIRNGRRSAIENSSPTFRLGYQKGIPGLNDSQSDFDRLDLTYRHTLKVGAGGKLDLKLNGGLFLNNNYVGFADYYHFPGNRMVFTTLDPVGSYRLLDYYSFSTDDQWLSAFGHYQFRKFLLTHIWEVQLMGLRENLFVNYLAAPTSEHYTEVGYSLDNILRVFRVELALAFRDGKYYDWGLRVGIASNLGGDFVNVSAD